MRTVPIAAENRRFGSFAECCGLLVSDFGRDIQCASAREVLIENGIVSDLNDNDDRQPEQS